MLREHAEAGFPKLLAQEAGTHTLPVPTRPDCVVRAQRSDAGESPFPDPKSARDRILPVHEVFLDPQLRR